MVRCRGRRLFLVPHNSEFITPPPLPAPVHPSPDSNASPSVNAPLLPAVQTAVHSSTGMVTVANGTTGLVPPGVPLGTGVSSSGIVVVGNR
jgi:hypothetical protein